MTAYVGSTEREIPVPKNIRVREEDFGLLFYNVDDQTLTFVHSKRLLDVVYREGRAWLRPGACPWSHGLERLIRRLAEKGLVVFEGR